MEYLSDEQMNKLASKIVKAEISGDSNLVSKLKTKLEAAREYKKKNSNLNNDDERVMLIATNSVGNSRPLVKTTEEFKGKNGKRKSECYSSGKRLKYYADDDKYNLSQMFEHAKYGSSQEDEASFAQIAARCKNPDNLDEVFMHEISKNKNHAKQSEQEKQQTINQHIKMEKSLDGCEYCIDSKKMLKHLMVSCGNKVYMALPSKRSLVRGHCVLTTLQHYKCATALDEDIWEEMMDYRKAITKMFDSQCKDVVFYETAMRFHNYPHVVVNCVPLPRDVGDTASIYFKKALLECESEWSMNKKVVDLKDKNVRKGIPKGLPYFWIDFGMNPGFAHVIEDQQLFPRTFAEEVIAGILDLDHTSWKNPRMESGDKQRQQVLEFIKLWKQFDPVRKNPN